MDENIVLQETKLLMLKEFIEIELDQEDEAQAAISVNPAVTWVKFILTDDEPNANKQRIPAEEFANLIKSGIFMPLKMAYEQINDGHDASFPIGVITHLKQHKNQVVGLAALWDKERPEDVSLIRDRYASSRPLQLSWEILFKNSSETEAGITELRDTALRAVTLVGKPAYAGRTPIIAVASEQATQTDSNLEDTTLEELEKLKLEIEQLQATLQEKETALASKETELASASTELEELRKFKSDFDSARAEVEKISKIKEKFTSAGIEKTEEYFASNKQTLLDLAPEALDFMIQEMVAFSALRNSSASTHEADDKSAPNLNGSGSGGRPTIAEMAEYLRKNK